MLGLSTKTFYAVAALYTLELKESNKAIKIKEIASSANIPQNFLEQILLSLKKSGILMSIKGAHGGYKLNRPLSEITLGNIIEILEDNYFQSSCKTDNDVLRFFWDDIQEKTQKNFDIPLCDFKTYSNKINQTLDFNI